MDRFNEGEKGARSSLSCEEREWLQSGEDPRKLLQKATLENWLGGLESSETFKETPVFIQKSLRHEWD